MLTQMVEELIEDLEVKKDEHYQTMMRQFWAGNMEGFMYWKGRYDTSIEVLKKFGIKPKLDKEIQDKLDVILNEWREDNVRNREC